jgi:hypothetical protein
MQEVKKKNLGGHFLTRHPWTLIVLKHETDHTHETILLRLLPSKGTRVCPHQFWRQSHNQILASAAHPSTKPENILS